MIIFGGTDLENSSWRTRESMVRNLVLLRIGDISRDVNRTFPTHILFKTAGGLGQMMLENVLRSLSEYFSNIGYCQVVIFVSSKKGHEFCCWCHYHRHCGSNRYWIRGEGSQWSTDSSEHCSVLVICDFDSRESQLSIEKRTFAIVVNLIRLMHMEELWSSGIPGLRRFVFILQNYMMSPLSQLLIYRQYCPQLLSYFEEIGYDVSIIVSKWFITLFAYVSTFHILNLDTSFSSPVSPVGIYPSRSDDAVRLWYLAMAWCNDNRH